MQVVYQARPLWTSLKLSPTQAAHSETNASVLDHSPGTVVDVLEAIWPEVHSTVPAGHNHHCIAHIH